MSKIESFSLRILKGVTGIERLRADWEEMFSTMSSRDFFHSYSWFDCYLRHLSSDPEGVMFCVISTSNPGCQAILPIERVNETFLGFNIDQLRIPSHPHLPLRDVVVSEKWSQEIPVSWFVRELNRQLPFRWHILHFDRALPHANILKILRPSVLSRTVVEHMDYSSFIVVNRGNPLNSLSKNFRSNLSRARNKLAKHNSVQFETSNCMPTLESAFEDFMDVEAAGWKGEQGAKSAIKLDESLVGFYRCLLSEKSEGVRCEIDCLRIDSEPVATQFALITDETVYQLKIGFNEEYSRLSPGNLLLEHLLSEYGRRGLKCFSLVSHTEWHRNWRAERKNVYSVFVFNSTLLGTVLFVLFRAKQALRPIYRKYIRRFFRARK